MGDPFIRNLENVYNELLDSRLVQTKDADQDSLVHFEEKLNQILPTNQEDHDKMSMLRNMYFDNKTGYQMCARKRPWRMLCTEGKTIAYHFQVQHLIYINWDRRNRVYHVVLNDKPPIANRRGVRSNRGNRGRRGNRGGNRGNRGRRDNQTNDPELEIQQKIQLLEAEETEEHEETKETEEKTVTFVTPDESINWADAADDS